MTVWNTLSLRKHGDYAISVGMPAIGCLNWRCLLCQHASVHPTSSPAQLWNESDARVGVTQLADGGKKQERKRDLILALVSLFVFF